MKLKLLAGTSLLIALALVAVAHAALGPYPEIGPGCTIFPTPPASTPANAPSLLNESAWNQDISKAPVDPNSAAYINYLGGHDGHIHPDFGSPREYGIPYSVVSAGQPKLPVHYTAYGDESDKGPFPIPATAPVEGGQNAEGDRHVITVDRDTCTLYELFGARYSATPKPHWEAESGAEWDLRSTKLRHLGFTSADAAGLPIFPGLVRYEEAAAGAIKHAIRVTFDGVQDSYIKPASHCAGDTSNPGAPPLGLRLRLSAGYGLGHFSGVAKAIAVAMKHYGLIVADNGSDWYISGTSDRRWPDETLDQLKQIPGSAFEVVKSAAAIHHC